MTISFVNGRTGTEKLKFTDGTGAVVNPPAGGSLVPLTANTVLPVLAADGITMTITAAPGFSGPTEVLYKNPATNPTQAVQAVTVTNAITVSFDETTFTVA